jgi:hypothetical protein
MESLALELRRRLSAHPAAVPLMIGGPMDGPHALALDERLLELLADAGLDDPTDTARAAYLLIVYVFGAIALEVAAHHEPGPLPPEAERIATRQHTFAATPADRYPRTAGAATTLARYISTEQYLWGLHRVLDGIATTTTAGPDAPLRTALFLTRAHNRLLRTGLAEIHGPPVVPTKLRAAATAYEHAINALTRAAQLAA